VPSPSSPDLHIGPFSGHWYGLLVSLGAVLFVLLAALLVRRRGGDAESAFWVCVAALPAALLGGRLWHLATDGSRDAAAFWHGGLSIFGAVAFGGAVLVGGARLRRLDPWLLLDCAVPGLALAQAVGRVGNWFNQELYGRPTSLPWGLEIDPENRLPGYAADTRFHPTFLYEALWDVALALILWRLVAGRPPVRRGIAFGVWLAGYGLGRFWIEGLRIEPAHHLGPLRLSQVAALVMVAAGVVVVLARARVATPAERQG
jgi:prolipoprotein diacylglyceryl transferase